MITQNSLAGVKEHANKLVWKTNVFQSYLRKAIAGKMVISSLKTLQNVLQFTWKQLGQEQDVA